MSHLNDILAKVATRGRSDVSLISLTSAYFPGADGIKDLEDWARDNGLQISYDPSPEYPCQPSQRRVAFCKLAR